MAYPKTTRQRVKIIEKLEKTVIVETKYGRRYEMNKKDVNRGLAFTWLGIALNC